MLNPFNVTDHPPWVTEMPAIKRWHAIDSQRLRCQYWWATSLTLKAAGWVLALLTVVVAGISAGHPGLFQWDEAHARSWATAVVVLSGISGLISWRSAGHAWGQAHEKLRDMITRYDADEKYSVEDVIQLASKAAVHIPHIEFKSRQTRGNSRTPPNKKPPVDAGS